MRLFLCFLVLVLTSFSFYNMNTQDNSLVKLDSIISKYEKHKGCDNTLHPLGLFTKEYYKSEASFASSLLVELKIISTDQLIETDQISYQLLGFVLEDKVSYYKFERYLNPLLSDAGFHNSLGFNVRPLND
jgi:uncharacterized protein (DUF885 family)